MRLLPLLALLLLAPLARAQQGADDILGKLRSLPPGTRIEFVTESASGTGVGVSTSGEKIDSNLQTSAPSTHLEPPTSTGGGSDSHIRVWGAQVSPASIALAIGGVLCWIGAALCVVRRWGLPRAPLVLFAAGLGFLAASVWTAALPYLAVGLLLGLLAVYLHSERGHSALSAALGSVTRGISDAETDDASAEAQKAAGLVKSYIKAHMTEPVKAALKSFKKAQDIP